MGFKQQDLNKIITTKYQLSNVNKKQTYFSVYLLLGLIFMTLTMTVFYDIPQLNLGLQLHSYADIRPKDSNKADNISVASLKEEWHNSIRKK